MDDNFTPTKKEIDNAEKNYPGAAINNADDEKTSEKLKRERTCVLDSNPNTDYFDTGDCK